MSKETITAKLKPPLEWSLGHIENLLAIIEPRRSDLTSAELCDYTRAKSYWDSQYVKN